MRRNEPELALAPAAGRAEAEELNCVALECESCLVADRVQYTGGKACIDFFHAPAARASKMVVMMVGCPAAHAEAMAAVGEGHPIEDTLFDEQIYRTEHGSTPELSVYSLEI
jgi:hypothetical protein